MQYKPVKTAVIGCGMISDIYLENLKDKFYIIDLIGCADMVDEKAHKQAEKYGIRKMTAEEILNDSEIELVLNLTYATSHFEMNKKILKAKKHCYCEKMMCLTMEEADELDNLRKANGVHFIVAPDTFLGASQQTARYIVDRGLIGEPVQAQVNLCRCYQLIKTTEDDAVRKFSVMHEGGGIPYDMGGYYLHELFNIFGGVESGFGYEFTRCADRPYLNPRHEKFDDNFFVNTPNTLSATLKFECGLLCNINIASDYLAYDEEFKIMGTEGILYLGDPNQFGDKVYIKKPNSEKMEFPLSHPYTGNSRGIGVADLAWAIRTGRNPRLSFEMGYHALEIITLLQDCEKDGMMKKFKTKIKRPVPISSEYHGGGSEERSLYLYE